MGNEIVRFIVSINFHETLMNGMLSFLLFAGALHVDWSDMKKGRWPILISGPLLARKFGGAAFWAMAVLLLLAYAVCAVIRWNIVYVEACSNETNGAKGSE